jgi:hypothetical protein
MRLVSGAGLTAAGLLAAGSVIAFDQGHWPPSKATAPSPKVAGMPAALAKNLASFDDLDFHVYTGQQWQNLHKSHAQDILVYYPDGHVTKGIPDHIKELNFMWTFAPDNRITEHSVRFGTVDVEWTAVMGFLDGTFTIPMTLADGTVLGQRRAHEADRCWQIGSSSPPRERAESLISSNLDF